MLANYHAHTTRCKHAKGTDREYVEAAIEGGLKVLGFSDHCPWIYDKEYVSGTRMLPAQLDDYVSSIEALKKEYKKDIKIYVGLEAEYIPEMIEAQYRLLDGYPLDYMIMGQHFTAKEYESPYTGFETTASEELIRYVDTVIEGMETGRYAYLAHPDLMNFVGDEAVYAEQYGRLCQYMKRCNVPLEINMLGLLEGRHYPSAKFFEIAKQAGNTVIIGCDAHSPDRLANKENFARCESWCEKAGLQLVEYLPGLGR